ncbi:MAG: hypothetical protein D6757_11270 [Alphaproteobacteria bacterium]|nr:MAG: hypothetical protein D6757_11270 [Alphaproteobacteria bacterium]
MERQVHPAIVRTDPPPSIGQGEKPVMHDSAGKGDGPRLAIKGGGAPVGLLLGVATGGFFLLVAAWYRWPGFFAQALPGSPVTWAMASAFADLVLIMAALFWFAHRQSRAPRPTGQGAGKAE